jgi:branched-chain amino acid aminotransferase
MAKCWLNGQLTDAGTAGISIRDAGLLHGAGAFTTMRAYGGKVFRLVDHVQRLRTTCQAMSIPLETSDEEFHAAVHDLIQANLLTEARLRITVTRGSVGDGDLRPNLFITAAPLQPYPDDLHTLGMTVLAYDQQKLNPYDIEAGFKTLNYFPRLAAMRDAASKKAGEALWFNVHNYLQSGSISNVFLVKEGKLLTPPTQADLADETTRERTPYPRSNVLPGITRKTVIEIALQEGTPVQIGGLTINDLIHADECFLTNSIMEIMPVCRIERQALGSDHPGDLTRRIAALYRVRVDRFAGTA